MEVAGSMTASGCFFASLFVVVFFVVFFFVLGFFGVVGIVELMRVNNASSVVSDSDIAMVLQL
jgi:hypothetical protein